MVDVNGTRDRRDHDLVALGEALICLAGSAGRLAAVRTLTKSVGGAEANVAIGLARLGLRSAYLTRVGEDPFGDEVVRTLRGEGVDVSMVERSAGRPTGLMVKETRAPDDVHVYYYRSGSAATEISAASLSGWRGSARHVHTTGITLALGSGPADAATQLMAGARSRGATVSFDPNFRLKLCSVEDAVAACWRVLPYVDDLLVSEAEALALTGTDEPAEALDRLAGRGVSRVVVRLGARGAIGASAGEVLTVPAETVPVVDTVGAGDAHTAGYLFERLRGGSFPEAMTTGAWTAGHVVSHAGDYEGLPYRREYDAWQGGRAAAVQR